jgi:DNA-directed RNA polymerase specialized sigma24 family protein
MLKGLGKWEGRSYTLMDKEQMSLNRESQEEALKQAKEAASSGDPRVMVEALHRSGYLDGLTAQMKSRWDNLPWEDLESIVAEAVQVLYVEVSKGKKVFNVKSYLWKSVNNMAYDFHEKKSVEDALTDEMRDDFIAAQVQEEQPDDLYDELDLDEKLKLAINIARSLISKLGPQNIQQVMEYIFDAVEAGREDVTAEEICEALGYTNRGTVRVWIQRGFERLAERAREEGILDRKFDVKSLKDVYGI